VKTPSPQALRSRSRARAAALVAAGLLAVIAPKLYAQVIRLGVVDMQRAILETDQGRRAKNQLKTLFEKRQVELDRRQNALKRMRDDLERQQHTLDQATLRQRAEEYQKQLVDLQQNYVQYQQELAQREAELTKQIYVNLEGLIRQIGQSQNYTAIFEQSGVVWSPQHLDLTDQVVQMYNQQYPPGREEPASPAPAASGAPASGAPASAAPHHPVANPHPRGENAPPAGH
jgi:outer membrane protein